MKALIQVIRQMTVPARIYVFGTLMFLLSWLFVPIRRHSLFVDFLIFSAFCFTIGFTIEVIQYISSIWGSRFAKFLLTLLGFLSVICLRAAKMFSAQYINELIPVDPKYFPFSMQVFTIVIVIILWLMIALIFYWFSIPFLISYVMVASDETGYVYAFLNTLVKQNTNSKEDKTISQPNVYLLFSRIMSAGILAFLVLSLLSIPSLYPRETDYYARLLIAWTDHYTYSTCQNQNNTIGERVAFLDGNKISVAIPDRQLNYTFEIRYCEP